MSFFKENYMFLDLFFIPPQPIEIDAVFLSEEIKVSCFGKLFFIFLFFSPNARKFSLQQNQWTKKISFQSAQSEIKMDFC